MRDNDLAPYCEKGDLLIVECTTDVQNGSLGLLYSKNKSDIILCRLYHTQGLRQLIAFIPQKNVGGFLVESQDILLGIVRELSRKV